MSEYDRRHFYNFTAIKPSFEMFILGLLEKSYGKPAHMRFDAIRYLTSFWGIDCALSIRREKLTEACI